MPKTKSNPTKSASKTAKTTRAASKRSAKETKPKEKKSTSSKSKKVATPKVETLKEDDKKPQTIPHLTKDSLTKEDVLSQFDDLVGMITQHISQIKGNKQHVTPKVLRELIKNVKVVRKNSSKLMRKSKVSKASNPNSGFLKPVKFSKEISVFTGWDMSETKSRVDVTKYLCNYIKENDLQNPEDRRQILVDDKLSKLLKYNPKKESEPLTYYRLQTYLKIHLS